VFCGDALKARREAELKDYFRVKHVFLFSSGKAALATLIAALRASSTRRNVVIPAYTCFSVPSAVVRGGGQVVLCDVDPNTMDFDFAQLRRVVDRDTLCVVSPHLLGQEADIRELKRIVSAHQVPVIEDAAQAMGGRGVSGRLGTGGDVGLFSLGRGKNITVGSGGILVTNSDELGEKLRQQYDSIPEESIGRGLANVVMVLAMAMLIHPRLYWMPASLPFLGLGETRFDPCFSIRRLDGIRAGLLATWRARVDVSNRVRADRSTQYLKTCGSEMARLGPCHRVDTAYLRFPVLLPTAAMKAEFGALSDRYGWGVRGLYPAPVSTIPELDGQRRGAQYSGAETLASRLITLPVHHYVLNQDIETISGALHAMLADKPTSTANGQCEEASRKTTARDRADEAARHASTVVRGRS
jgi:dTDP-4-amino-4,6-dideoxygalactose transaminase